MKILLAYAGKHGTAKLCVERLRDHLPKKCEAEAICLGEQMPDPSSYDIVVFGSSVYHGKLLPEAKQFIAQYSQVLQQKPLALFLVCGLAHEYEYYRDKLLPATLREHSFLTLYFGGSLSTKGLSPMEWLRVKSMRSMLFEEDIDNGEYTPTLPGILPENIDRMATYLRREMETLSRQQK